MNYKEEQLKTRAMLKPRVLKQHWGSNRAQRRNRVVNRLFTKQGYNFGRKIGSAADNIVHYLAKVQEQK